MSAAAVSPFASAAPDLQALGYAVLPLIPPDTMHHGGRGKCPAEYRGGGYQGMGKWQRFRDTAPSSFEMGLWSKWPDANIGLVMGSSVGRDLHVIALDFDAEDPDALDTLLRAAPASPMVKRGQKGETRFYLAAKSVKTASYDGPDGRLLDLLTGFDTRQTVVPPSIHPKTHAPYVWLKGPVAASDLPVLDADDMEALEEALEQCGWERGGRTGGRIVRNPHNSGPSDDDDLWSETKAAALSNLSAWVPALDLYGCRPARGGYEAVAHWRASSSGRAMAERKLNLSIQASGIKDFGTNDTYSAIDLVMSAQDVDQSAATSWLRERLELDDSGVVIDLRSMGIPMDPNDDLPEPLRGLPEPKTPTPSYDNAGVRAEVLGGEAEDEAGTAPEPTHEIAAELPASLCQVPGLVGDIANWITATARKPQPSLSLAMALGLVGTVAGRKFCGPTQSATHLYFLCTGPTGSGKNAPKKAAGQLLAAANLRGLIGPSSFTSASALIQHVSRAPASLCVMDEFSMLIGKLNSKNGSTHERAISGEMRQFWSLSFEEYVPPRWAASRDRMQPEPIISPALSIIGLTTADEVYSVLQGGDVVSGFLNRFLLVATLNNPLDVEPSADVFEPPAALIAGLQAIAGVGGPLAQATMHHEVADRPIVAVPWEDGPGGTAHNVFKALVATVATMTENEALTQRCAEIAVRLATIRAIGISGANARVTVDDMSWGSDFALWSTRRLIADVEAHMVESDHQARAKFVLRIIAGSEGGYISRTALCRRVNHRFDARTLDSVIGGLLDAGQIRLKESERQKSGRPASGYFAA